MKKRFLRIKNDFKELTLPDKLFNLLTIVLMLYAFTMQLLKGDDAWDSMQLGLNLTASFTTILARLLFKETSLIGSLSMKCQKYIDIIILFGSFGGQYISPDIDNYDTMTHLVTGSVVCFIGYHIYEHYAKEPAYKKPTLCSTYSFFLSMSVALFWEIFEFTSDFLFSSRCQGYNLPADDSKFFYFRAVANAASKIGLNDTMPELQNALYDTFADVYAALFTGIITAVIIGVVLRIKKAKIEKLESKEEAEEVTV